MTDIYQHIPYLYDNTFNLIRFFGMLYQFIVERFSVFWQVCKLPVNDFVSLLAKKAVVVSVEMSNGYNIVSVNPFASLPASVAVAINIALKPVTVIFNFLGIGNIPMFLAVIMFYLSVVVVITVLRCQVFNIIFMI